MKLKIIDIDYEYETNPGCETCDYGSSYIVEFIIKYEDESKLHFYVAKMYDDGVISESDLMKILANAKSKGDVVVKVMRIIDGYSGMDNIKYTIKEINGDETVILKTNEEVIE